MNQDQLNDRLDRIDSRLRPHGFAVDDHCRLCTVKKKDDGEEALTPLANFVPEPVSELLYVSRNGYRPKYEIRGYRMNDAGEIEVLDSVIVDADEFERIDFSAKWGLQACTYPVQQAREKLRFATKCQYREKQRRYVMTQLGWVALGSKLIFVHADGVIGDAECEVEVPSQLQRYKLPAADSTYLLSAIKASLFLLVIGKRTVTYPLLSATLLGPLSYFLPKKSKFVTWHYGPSGCCKTSLICLMLCHYGEFSDGVPPASFRSTVNGLERQLHDAGSVLTVIDDYYPASNGSDAARMVQVADSLLRAKGDRVGKQRMGADLRAQESLPPEGEIAVTAEDLPPAGESTFGRIMPIEMSRDSINLDRLTKAQANSHLLPYAMRGYIEWLLRNMPQKDPAELTALFTELRQNWVNKCPHRRMEEALTLLQISLYFFTLYAVETGAIDNEKRQILLEKNKAALNSLISSQRLIATSRKPTQRFREVVDSLIRSNQILILERRASNSQASSDNNGSVDARLANRPIAGYRDSSNYYFLPEAIFARFRQALAASGERAALTKTTLFKSLAAEDLILCDPDRHLTKSVTINGKKGRFLVIPRENIDNMGLEQSDDNESPNHANDICANPELAQAPVKRKRQLRTDDPDQNNQAKQEA